MLPLRKKLCKGKTKWHECSNGDFEHVIYLFIVNIYFAYYQHCSTVPKDIWKNLMYT